MARLNKFMSILLFTTESSQPVSVMLDMKITFLTFKFIFGIELFLYLERSMQAFFTEFRKPIMYA